MTLLFPQSTNGETISIPAGTHTGHVRITKHDVTFQGAGVDVSTIVPDGQDARVFHATALISGEPCTKVTLRDLTIDCNRLTSLVAAVLCSHTAGSELGPLELVMERVKIKNHYRSTSAILVGRYGTLRDVEIVGNGGGITVGSTTQPGLGCKIERLTVTGCAWSAQLQEQADGSAGVVPGFDVQDAHIVNDYWANPIVGQVVTPTAFAAQYVDVDSHTTAQRSSSDVLRVLAPVDTHEVGTTLTGVQKWDRLEMEDGTWTQVLSVGSDGLATLDTWRDSGYWTSVSQPSGTATIYRVTLGRIFSWTSTRLLLTVSGVPTDARWHTVEGEAADTPSIVDGLRVEIIRAATGLSSSIRDVNIQPIHATKAARGARIARCVVRGSYADSYSIRGTDGIVEDCIAELGQDMGFTVDVREGAHTLRRCSSRTTGVAGFTIFGEHGARLEECSAWDSGHHSTSIAGYGFHVDDDARSLTKIYQSRGSGSRVDLFNENGTACVAHHPRRIRRREYDRWS